MPWLPWVQHTLSPGAGGLAVTHRAEGWLVCRPAVAWRRELWGPAAACHAPAVAVAWLHTELCDLTAACLQRTGWRSGGRGPPHESCTCRRPTHSFPQVGPSGWGHVGGAKWVAACGWGSAERSREGRNISFFLSLFPSFYALPAPPAELTQVAARRQCHPPTFPCRCTPHLPLPCAAEFSLVASQEAVPSLLTGRSSPLLALWHRPEASFQVPKAAMYCHLHLPGKHSTACSSRGEGVRWMQRCWRRGPKAAMHCHVLAPAPARW